MPVRMEAVIVMALVLLGVWLRFRGLGESSLWGDELLQRQDARNHGFWDFLFWRHDPTFGNHAPLGFMVNRLWWLVSGSDSAWAWRFPSAFFGVLCIPAGWWMARQGGNQILALAFAALITADPNQVDISQAARMYSLLLFLSLIGLGLAFRWLPGSFTWKKGMVLGLVLIAAGWTHFLAAVIAPCLGLAWLVLHGKGLAKNRRDLAGWSLVFIVVVLVANIGLWKSLVWGLGSGTQVPEATSFVHKLGFVRWNVGTLAWIPLPGANSLVLLLSAIGLGYGLISRNTRFLVVSLALIAVATLAGQFYILTKHTFITQRYLALFQPAWWLGLASIALLPGCRWIRAGGVALLAGYLSFQTWHCLHLERSYETIFHSRQDGRTVRDVQQFFQNVSANAEHPVLFPGGKGYQRLALDYLTVPLASSGETERPGQWRLYHIDTLSDEKTDVGLSLEKRRDLVKAGARWYVIRERDGVEEMTEFR